MSTTTKNGVWKMAAGILAGAVVAGSSTWMLTATHAARQEEATEALRANVAQNSRAVEAATKSQHSTETQLARIDATLDLVLQELQRVRGDVRKLAER